MSMIIDENTAGILQANDYLVLPHITPCSDITFKASFIVSSDLACSGRITALFDLVVIGDITAKEVEVKGKLVCMGKCHVDGTITVQNEIWVDELTAENIESHDRIVAQELDGTCISADGSIIIAKTMAVEEIAKSKRNVLCGETAYGAGRVIANTIITGEPIDLDDGEEGFVSPQVYMNAQNVGGQPNDTYELSSDFEPNNDYKGYIDALIKQATSDIDKIQLLHWRNVLCEVQDIVTSNSTQYRNVETLLWMTEIVNSAYFSKWNTVRDWYQFILDLFTKLSHNESPDEPTAVAAKTLCPGDVVLHNKYGRGRVTSVNNAVSGKIASVNFIEIGSKSFVITADTIKLFKTILHDDVLHDGQLSDYASSIKCEISNYTDWIRALQVLNLHGASYDQTLFKSVFDLVASNLGLRAKFVSDRLSEKGWKMHV